MQCMLHHFLIVLQSLAIGIMLSVRLSSSPGRKCIVTKIMKPESHSDDARATDDTSWQQPNYAMQLQRPFKQFTVKVV